MQQVEFNEKKQKEKYKRLLCSQVPVSQIYSDMADKTL